MRTRFPFRSSLAARILALCLLLSPLSGLQAGLPAALSAEHEQVLNRAREILGKASMSEGERAVRLQVLKAVLTGTVVRPDEDYPEMRNPDHWVLSDDGFVVAPGSAPVDAISDLWVEHENDGVPIPRIRCYKYSSLTLIQGCIQHCRDTGNAGGLAVLNRLLGHQVIPQDLPNGGDDLFWKQEYRSGPLLPGDQVWFENPFFEPGRALMRQQALEQALREGKTGPDAVAAAEAMTDSLSAGEEGSNVFYVGDNQFARGGASVTRLCRASFQEGSEAQAHELVLTTKIYSFPRFQEHMIDDNYTAQACLRKDPATVRPEHFTIGSVRSPLDPEVWLKRYAVEQPGPQLDGMIDAMASRNRPPQLVGAPGATVPVFGEGYDWAEQQRVRLAIEAVRRLQSDELWWKLRAAAKDNRYVLTASRGKEIRNFTVGELCSDIVDARLCLGFTSHLPSVPGKLPPSFRPEREFWRREAEWAQARAPLFLMQAALCERAIQEWGAVQGTLPGSDGIAHIYSSDEKARFVLALKKEIDERTTTRRARYEEVVVPWLPAPSGWDGYDAIRAQEALAVQRAGLAGAH